MKTISILILSCSLIACGGALHDARKVVEHGARAGSQADAALASLYVQAHVKAYSNAPTRAEYDQQMALFDDAADAVVALHAALLVAESALDVWEVSGSDADWQKAVGCVLTSVALAHMALQSAGVKSPEAFGKVIKFASMFGSKDCQGAP